MLRVVHDTNVAVPALLFRAGRLAWLRDAWGAGTVVPLVCGLTIAELEQVLLYPKFDLDAGGVTALLAAYLEHKRLLLVLDNCEHLVWGCAQLASALLGVCPGLTLLATSREPLRVEGEHAYRLPGLEVPPPGEGIGAEEARRYSAVALFLERASAVQSSFQFRDADVSPVIDICHRLDGIPLAIELAAARVDTFGVGELSTRLDDRFMLLTSGRRTAMPRDDRGPFREFLRRAA